MAPLPIDDEHAPLFSVGQVASMLHVQHAFLRRLDEFEVVRPSRSDGGQRRYSRIEITRVQYVLELVDEGMTLAAIRRILFLETRVRQLQRKVAALEEQREELGAAVAERDALLARLEGRRGPAGPAPR
jgi:MerR family transcriptional regulator, heat shock protein HspR